MYLAVLQGNWILPCPRKCLQFSAESSSAIISAYLCLFVSVAPPTFCVALHLPWATDRRTSASRCSLCKYDSSNSGHVRTTFYAEIIDSLIDGSFSRNPATKSNPQGTRADPPMTVCRSADLTTDSSRETAVLKLVRQNVPQPAETVDCSGKWFTK